MRKIGAILITAVIAGCALNAEPVKTFTAVRVTKDNIFSFGLANQFDENITISDR